MKNDLNSDGAFRFPPIIPYTLIVILINIDIIPSVDKETRKGIADKPSLSRFPQLELPVHHGWIYSSEGPRRA